MDGLAIGGLKKRAGVSVESAPSWLVGHYDTSIGVRGPYIKKGVRYRSGQ